MELCSLSRRLTNTNAAPRERLTRVKKATQKIYRTTTTQPGSMKEVKAGVLREAHPTRAIEKAVKGMLPKGPLGNAMLKKLIVYAGTDHQQKAQNPIAFSLKK